MTVKKHGLPSIVRVRFVLADKSVRFGLLLTLKIHLKVHNRLRSIFTAKNKLDQDEKNELCMLLRDEKNKLHTLQLLIMRADPDSQPKFIENESKRWLVEYLGLASNNVPSRLFVGRL